MAEIGWRACEGLSLSTLPKLRKLVVCGNREFIDQVDRSVFSKFDKSTRLVVTSDSDDVHANWRTPFEE